jgi:holo-[acyl-carrier protein] synthase
MIYGIGTDLVTVSRIEAALFRHGDRFLHRILTEAEVAEYAAHRAPARFLAKRFAVKEAFSKAFGTGIGAECGWHDISVAHDARGKPMITPSAALQLRMRARNIAESYVSLSDERDQVIAFVIIEQNLAPS